MNLSQRVYIGSQGTSVCPESLGALTCRKCYSFLVLTGSVRFFMLVVALAGLTQGNSCAAKRIALPESERQAVTQQHSSASAQGRNTEGDLASIIQSGSTNTRPYKVVIHTDGSATAEIGGTSSAVRIEPPRLQQFPPGTVDTKTLLRLLTEIADVSKIPTRNCAKSVSFGTRTEISYAGKTSGDLECIRNDASEGDQANLQVSGELSKFVQTTLRQLKANVSRLSSAP